MTCLADEPYAIGTLGDRLATPNVGRSLQVTILSFKPVPIMTITTPRPDDASGSVISKRLATLLLLAVFGAEAALAQQPTDPAASERDRAVKVERLIAALDARTLSERQAAERELIDLGLDILGLLPRENDLPTAEMRQRLRRIRSQLEQLESTTSIDATPITIRDARTLGDALGQITRQTKVQFSGAINASLPVKIHAVKIPFWNAVDEVLDAADLDIDRFGGVEQSLKLVPRSPDRPRRSDTAAYSGVFRIEPISVTARRDLHNPRLSGLDLMIDISWELRLTPIGLSLPLKEFGAKLDNGDVLQLQASAETAEAMPNAGIPSTQTSIPFQLPAGRPAKIDTLSGTIDALLPGKIKHFDFDLGSDTFPSKDAGDVTVTLESVRGNGSLHELRVNVKFKQADRALESHRGWVFDNPAYVTAANTDPAETPDDGSDKPAQPTRIENLGYEIYRQTSDEIGIGYLFDLESQPARFQFHYETPSSIVRSEVRFTLHDILLP
ncbi:hypothetical protein Poly24_16780 [Rosistilla carotiformis]|uniref:Uncharacterized protein n=1 Tax=Rosistilla carotiformis TaxID=2528017 RepID=A0A518JR05_9BACT|nr:hypothetical protein [Rosistilla carotiformis]QDV67972.1 hypothetical protein Poly24_16780 [Rosistilla carotiformis]